MKVAFNYYRTMMCPPLLRLKKWNAQLTIPNYIQFQILIPNLSEISLLGKTQLVYSTNA